MPRRIKDHFEIRDYSSLDEVIGALMALRNRLPADAEPEMKLRGDDVFGRTLMISYFREQTADEAALDRRYQFGRGSAEPGMRMVA